MSRWLLALLFAFGSVTFLTGCPAEDDSAGDDAADVVDDAADAVDDAADDAADAVDDATDAVTE